MSNEIILFSAPWCNPCKALKERLSCFPDIRIVDIEENPHEAEKYFIRNVPVLVKLVDGDAVDIVNNAANMTRQQFESWAWASA